MNCMFLKQKKSTLVFVLLCSFLALSACSKKADDKTAVTMPPVVVSAAKIVSLNYHPSIEALGRLEANRHATLSSEVPGIVKTIHFNSGETVSKGSLLVELNHEIDEARLKEKEAQLTLANQTLNRRMSLRKTKSISQAELDEAKTNFDLARGETELLKAMLNQKFIRAPFNGKLGLKKIEMGEFINPGNPIINLQDTHTIKVDFSIPEEYLPNLKQSQKIEFVTDAHPNETFYAQVSAIDVETENNHMIKVEGVVNNADEKLYPGLFARLKLFLGQTETVLTVPKTAINYSLYGNSVFVADCKDNKCKAKQQYVLLGNSIGDHVIIKSGLSESDTVVTSGQLKVHNDDPIVIHNDKSLEN